MKKNEIAAIIGYWRNGMEKEFIALVMDTTKFTVNKIIKHHLKNAKR